MCVNKKKSDNITDSANSIQSHIEIAPFQRVGLGNDIAEKEWISNKEETKGVRLHPTVNVSMKLDLDEAEAETPISTSQYVRKSVSLIGPYEARGLSPKAIARVFPPDKDMSFERNHMPYVEFAEPDLPWRYTPAVHNENKLTPWLSLIACKSDEFTLARDKEGMQIVTIKDEKAWSKIFGEAYQNAPHLWAHVENAAEKPFSRLLCPRELDEYTAYTVFLIPTYELTRLSGLGFRLPEHSENPEEPIEKNTLFDIPVQTRAWATKFEKQQSRQRGLEFPVYYLWRFQTSTGDFHALARKLEAISTKDLPKDVKVDVSKMGVGLDYDVLTDPPKEKSVGVAMASMPIDYQQDVFPKEGSELSGRMKDLLNKSHIFVENQNLLNSENGVNPDTIKEDPWVVPPVYGAKHVLATSLDKKPDGSIPYPWLYELNTQVPNRIAAGLGVEVIKQNQEQLVQRAWEQVGEVMEFNQKIREKFFGISAGKDLYYNKVGNLRKEELKERLKGASRNETINLLIQLLLNLSVSLDTPLNTMNDGEKGILAQLLKDSGFPPELINPSIQKLLRTFNRTDNRVADGTEISLIRTMLENQSGIFNLDNQQAILNYKVADLVRKIQENLDYYRRAAVRESLELLRFMSHYWVEALGAKEEVNFDVLGLPKGWIKDAVKNNKNSLTPSPLSENNTTLENFFYKMPYGVNSFSDFYNVYFKKCIDSNNTLITLYNQYDALLKEIAPQIKETQTQEPKPIDWEKLAPKILDVVQETMTDKNKQLTDAICDYLESSGVINPEEYNKNRVSCQNPILAYPYFAEPTYYYLNKLSSKYILPAIEDLPNNTISLFRDNAKFIESYICGLNTEMGKELFWREYPTDRRGSYFEKFWDSESFYSNHSYIPDVNHQYDWYGELGRNHLNEKPLLIFVVKGELMKKYPDVLVYLASSQIKGNRVLFDDNIKMQVYPELKARISKDTTLYGFRIGFNDLLIDGGRFLTFKERPGKLSFKNIDAKENESIDTFKNTTSADYANKKVAEPCIYAKHVSALLSK